MGGRPSPCRGVFVHRLTDTPMAGRFEGLQLLDPTGQHSETQARRDHGFIGGSTHALTASHDNGTVTRFTRGGLRPQPGPEAVGCSPLPSGPGPARAFLLAWGGQALGGLGPEKGASRERGPGRRGWPPSLQGLEHQQLFQHLRLAGLTDLASQEHLVHDCVNLSEGRVWGDPGMREGYPPPATPTPATDAGLDPGSPALLVPFSSPGSPPCRN